MKSKLWIFALLALCSSSIFFSSCEKEDTNNVSTIVKDIDGNIYNKVEIGNQTWLLENLKTTKYRNGDAILNGISSENTTGAYEIYDDLPSNNSVYGKLYNWYAVEDSRGVCPTGWHVPSDAEWKTLEMHLGMSPEEADQGEGQRGTDEGGKLKVTGTDYWNSPNTGATNESGFSALPGGAFWNENFVELKTFGGWWTSSLADDSHVWYRYLSYDHSEIHRKDEAPKHAGFSVRCLKDN